MTTPPPGPPPLSASEPPDDVDRVFARLGQYPPPRGFADAVLAAVAGQVPGRLSPLWLVTGVLALAAVGVLAFLAGQAVVGGGLLALLATVGAEDGEVLRLDPVDTLFVALDLVPWIELGGCALAAVVLGIALRRVVAPAVTPTHPAAAGGGGG